MKEKREIALISYIWILSKAYESSQHSRTVNRHILLHTSIVCIICRHVWVHCSASTRILHSVNKSWHLTFAKRSAPISAWHASVQNRFTWQTKTMGYAIILKQEVTDFHWNVTKIQMTLFMNICIHMYL